MIEERVLLRLQVRANARGIVPVRRDVLVEEVGATVDEVTTALGRLERAGLITVLTPPPYLVLKLRSWPGKRSETADSAALATPAYSFSRKLLQPKRLNSSYRPPGERPAVDVSLLQEILETLGEGDGASFAKAVELYSPHVIRIALDRVRRTRGIRKNRTALFRHLLPRLAAREHRFNPLT